MDRDLVARYRFFREHACGSPGYCLDLARAEKRAGELGLGWAYEDEQEPWDADCPAPDHNLCVYVFEAGDTSVRGGPDWLASLGHVGVDSLNDPYLRVVAAELFDQVLSGPEYQRGAPGAVCTTG